MTSIPTNSRPGRRIWLERACLAAFLLLAIVSCFHLAAFVAGGVGAINDPGELDYGEGIVWQQMLMMFDGRGYGPIDGFPSIVFHYPPLYHAVVHLLSGTGVDPLVAGRTVSLVSTLVAALLVGAITYELAGLKEEWGVRLISGAAAALIAICWFPVTGWSPLMRVDMLGTALSLAGLLLSLKAFERPRLIYGAALLFVAGVYTKQTMIAAPAAAFTILLIARPAIAVRGIATAVAVGLTLLVALAFATDGGFLRHIFLYNLNEFLPADLMLIFHAVPPHAVFFIMAAIGLIQLIQELRNRFEGAGWIQMRTRLAGDSHASRTLVLIVYALLCLPMLLMIGKAGSNVNYFIEWMFVLSIFAGLSAIPGARLVLGCAGRTPPFLFACIVPAAIAFQCLVLPASPYRAGHPPEMRADLERLGVEIRAAQKPVISDDMVLLLKNGREVVWESAISYQLARNGILDDRPFIRKILAGDFAFFITVGERYNPAVRQAITTAYPSDQVYGKLTVHRPAGSQSGTRPKTPELQIFDAE